MKTKPHRENGRSLFEVFIVLATIVLLAIFFMPTAPRSKVRAKRIICTSNLKQLGISYRLWSGDHGDQYPFASTNTESSLAFASSPQVFRHYAIMSNELSTPKILVCPTDVKKTKAIDFVSFSNTNISYFVGLDAIETDPQRFLSGDRNITGGILSNGFMRFLTPTSAVGWTAKMHGNVGNIGLADGSVQQVNLSRLQTHLQIQTQLVVRLAIP
jgi:prepilin-type processing-associated H-X9-DG protein